MSRSVSRIPSPIILLLAAGCVSVLAACSFVRLSEEGADVVQAEAADIVDCTYRGEITTNTKEKVVFKRGSGKVQEELTVLARNDAAKLGANAIVAQGTPVDGTQKYKAYRCN